jgi:protein tyrosine/serine phosphatase
MSEVAVQASIPRRRPLALRGGILLALGIAIGVAGFFLWKAHARYHLAVVQPGVLYRDGLKSSAQFAATLDRAHPKTVVSLIDEKEMSDPGKPQLAAEAELCSRRGITLDRIPVTLGGWPNSADVQKFLAIVADKENQPVLVHCAQGVRRTGMFVAAYQESVLGYDKARAKAAVLSFGHGRNTVEQIDRFIDGYDPKTQTVPADLGGGSE